MLDGLAAFVYVAALWFAAPALLRAASVADRLRMVIVLGVAVPGVLALLHLLYAPLVWLAAATLVFWRVRKGARTIAQERGIYATLAAVLIVVWAPLARPLLDGDTLLYHLPNAVAFVQAHSVWAARAPYWMYPPASELFAAGLFAVSGRWGLPVAGILPAMLLAARLYTIARENGASQFAAASVPLAFVCTPVAAFQVGTLQNDLWLAAFFVEVLAADRSAISLAACALLKPYGWIEGLIGAIAARVPWRNVVIALVPLAIWIVRDAILLRSGTPLGFSPPSYLATSILGNFATGIAQLAHGVSVATPQAFVWLALLAAGAFFSVTRRFALAGIAALLLYIALPVSYSDGGTTNYVLDASSLRYALPALAAGALMGAILVNRAGVLGTLLAYAVATWGAWNVLSVFWNDSYTHWAIAAAAIAVVCALMPHRIRGAALAAAAFAVMLAGAWSASSRAQGFYGDWMRQPSGKPTGAFAWISRHSPPRVVAVNVRSGAIEMSSPRTRTWNANASDLCAQTRRERALLFVGSNEELEGAGLAQAMTSAKSCGQTLYEDGAAVIVAVP